jgi:hypothetical protein
MGGFTPAVRTDPTVVAGVRDTGSVPGQRIIADVKDEIVFVMPSAAPVTYLTKRFRKREVTQYSYDWLEKDLLPRMCDVVGAVASGDTTINVAAGQGTRVPKNAIMLNRRTREQVLVTVITTDALTVVRGIGGINEAMVDGDKLEFLRAVFEDGSSKGDYKSTKEDRLFNYTEIIRTGYGFTGRQMNTSMYGGKDPATERKAQAVEHSISIENMLLFGRRHTRTGSNGKLQTMSGGAEFFIKTNVWDLGGNEPNVDQIVEVLEEVMKHGRGGYLSGGSRTKWGFFAPRWCSKFQKMAHDKIFYRPADTALGIKIGQLDTIHGTLMIVEDPILTGPEHGGWGMILDLNHAFYVYHQGRDTKLLDNRQANDVDGTEEEYLTDCGAQIELEFAHAIFKGLPGF